MLHTTTYDFLETGRREVICHSGLLQMFSLLVASGFLGCFLRVRTFGFRAAEVCVCSFTRSRPICHLCRFARRLFSLFLSSFCRLLSSPPLALSVSLALPPARSRLPSVFLCLVLDPLQYLPARQVAHNFLCVTVSSVFS